MMKPESKMQACDRSALTDTIGTAEPRALEAAFTDWWIEHAHVFEFGCVPELCDLESLRIRLNAAARSARKS